MIQLLSKTHGRQLERTSLEIIIKVNHLMVYRVLEFTKTKGNNYLFHKLASKDSFLRKEGRHKEFTWMNSKSYQEGIILALEDNRYKLKVAYRVVV